MEDNPYSKMLGIMRRQGKSAVPITFSTGAVLSASPLSIQVGGLTMSGAELLVNPQLLKGYKRNVSVTEVEPEEPLPSCKCKTEYLDDELQPGDTVALLTLDEGQRFVVLCKVVSS